MATMNLLLVVSLVAVLISLPARSDPAVQEADSNVRQAWRRQLVLVFPFLYTYINAEGQMSSTEGELNTTVKVTSTPHASYRALQAAEDIVVKMTKYMPSEIFTMLSNNNAGVGVFTRAETLTAFYEYYHLRDDSCGMFDCSGSCSSTCTADGRKYTNLPGLAGRLSVVVEDNILCTLFDPYVHKLNLLVQEFAITVFKYGLSSETVANITNAYQAAKSAATWDLTSWAMTTAQEYFAVATTVFFGVEKSTASHPGGMNLCGTNSTICSTEMEGRNNLMIKDPALYDILSYVYTDNRPDLLSGLAVCPESGTVVGKR